MFLLKEQCDLNAKFFSTINFLILISYVVLDIILAHNDLNFSSSVIVSEILRISAPREGQNIFEGILLERHDIFTNENRKESLLS